MMAWIDSVIFMCGANDCFALLLQFESTTLPAAPRGRTVNDHQAQGAVRPFDPRIPPAESCLAAQIGAGCTDAVRIHRLRIHPVLSSTHA